MNDQLQNDSVEPELTGHNYDGIQEYDNPLPGWWKLVFWGSLVFSIGYWGWFHIWPGQSIEASYAADMAAHAPIEPETPLLADEATILGLMADPAEMEKAAGQFTMCAACHLPDGGGIVGPNLTDDSYLRIKTLVDFVPIIRDGIPDKGMTAAAVNGLKTEADIIRMAAYAASLRGTTPATAKAAEGEVVAPWPSH